MLYKFHCGGTKLQPLALPVRMLANEHNANVNNIRFSLSGTAKYIHAFASVHKKNGDCSAVSMTS